MSKKHLLSPSSNLPREDEIIPVEITNIDDLFWVENEDTV
jgi:hypothetical protein